jgi:NAD(P)-dependent dehydrogenase (short-subunit alcohol dehydrogenase family)
MPRYLISGIAELVSDVAAVLREFGAEVVEVDDIADVPRVSGEASPHSFDGYVQLPASFTVQGDCAVERVHHFFADGVLARFPAVHAALPALAPGARLTFVTGVLPREVSTDDDVAARAALIRILGHAARADAPEGLRVTVLGSGSSPKEIALTALGRGAERGTPTTELSEEAYAEWRMDLLGIMWAET